jgi:energy-coupling factor transporter ATP-binding protein EcfA2
MPNKITKLKKIDIKKFRGLADIEIPFGERITVICGKNGTSKSTILGIIAQAFSFSKDYTKLNGEDLLATYRTLDGQAFHSEFSDHFRLSNKYDISGSMDIAINLYDGAEDADLNLKMGLYKLKDRPKPRPIIRGNTKTNGADSSRNVTHPLIYLSLSRLLPIALRPKYSPRTVDYLKKNEADFKKINNKLLNKSGPTEVTATTGTMNSVVVHGETYDQESVSAGEDNVGQILQALFSFRKLKEDYPDYHGGILLIDEADAGLFPAAQTEFISLMSKLAKELNLQIVITSHSPTMIEKVFLLSQKDNKNYKTIYLTDAFGGISARENWSWPQIYADLHIETVKISDEIKLPEINVYFEDREANDFFNALVTDRKLRRPLKIQSGITLGCDNYKDMIKRKILEFSRRSVIVFDADVDGISEMRNVVQLPGIYPPDQLLFEFLFNLDPADKFWMNQSGFTKAVFNKISSNIISRLDMHNFPSKELSELIEEDRKKGGGKPIREDFKEFYKNNDLQKIIHGKVRDNPFRLWALRNAEKREKFQSELRSALRFCLSQGYGVDALSINSYLN